MTTPVPATPTSPVPLSPVQADALRDGSGPPLERIRDGIWTFSIPFGAGIPDYTLTYVVEGSDGSLTLIDPGWGTDATLGVLEDGLAGIGRTLADVSLVAVTHLHVDHLGAADAVRRASGARVAMHPNEVRAIVGQEQDRLLDVRDIETWGLPEPLRADLMRTWGTGRGFPDVAADLLVEDGDVLPIPGRTIRALWTPGHTTGHLCFVDEQDDLLFTGDHVLPRINSGLGLGGRTDGNPLEDYLASLERVSAFGDLEVCPGHEFRFHDVAARAATLADHRRERGEFVARALDALDHPTVFEVASRVPFRGGIASMQGYLLASALAQTSFHIRLLGRESEVARG